MSAPSSTPRYILVPLWAIGVVAVAAFLQHSATVLAPIFAAFFLAITLAPIQLWLRRVLPAWLRGVATPIVSIIPVAVVAGLVAAAALVLESMVPDSTSLSDLVDRVEAFIRDILEQLPFAPPTRAHCYKAVSAA